MNLYEKIPTIPNLVDRIPVKKTPYKEFFARITLIDVVAQSTFPVEWTLIVDSSVLDWEPEVTTNQPTNRTGIKQRSMQRVCGSIPSRERGSPTRSC